MILVCIRRFGNFHPGDEVADVPDDATYDTAHFAAKDSANDSGEKPNDQGDAS